MKIMLIVLLSLAILQKTYTQKLVVVDNVSKEYQHCLDKDYRMTGCSRYFLYQMDSLLNVYYNDLRKECNTAQKANLKKEQLVWLKKRDKQFILNAKEADLEAKREGFSEYVELMFEYDKNAKTVKKRVIKLAKAKPNHYSANQIKLSLKN